MRDKNLKAGFTIEMSIIVPLILFVFCGLIVTVFYYHDKNILHGAAYETAVVGSSKMREQQKIEGEEMERFCRDKIQRKCIFLTQAKVSVDINENEISVKLNAGKRGFRLSVEKRMAITEPEKKIRDIRRLDIRNGKKSND